VQNNNGAPVAPNGIALCSILVINPRASSRSSLQCAPQALGLHHYVTIQHNVGIMRSVWLALPVKNGNANQATVRAARRIIYAMLNASFAVRRRQAAKNKLKKSTLCAL
jgi:hypothetical protein